MNHRKGNFLAQAGSSRRQSRQRLLMFVILGCSGILGAVVGIRKLHRAAIRAVKVEYALHQTTDMIVWYTREHSEPPLDWVELATVFDEVNSGYNIFSLRELKGIVHVDFDAIAAGWENIHSGKAWLDSGRVITAKVATQSKQCEIDANARLRREFMAFHNDSMSGVAKQP